ncbi:5525_t:CDS:1, partial [Racocetra fulgida]
KTDASFDSAMATIYLNAIGKSIIFTGIPVDSETSITEMSRGIFTGIPVDSETSITE